MCRAQPFLDDLTRRFPELRILQMEIMTTPEHRPLLIEMAAAHDVRPGSVPMAFLGGEVWTGDSRPVREAMVATIEACLRQGCPASR